MIHPSTVLDDELPFPVRMGERIYRRRLITAIGAVEAGRTQASKQVIPMRLQSFSGQLHKPAIGQIEQCSRMIDDVDRSAVAPVIEVVPAREPADRLDQAAYVLVVRDRAIQLLKSLARLGRIDIGVIEPSDQAADALDESQPGQGRLGPHRLDGE